MTNNVFVKFRSFLPGAGHNRSGVAKQGKTNVRGRLEVTYSRGGDSLTPSDLGLASIDDLVLTLEEPFTSEDPGQKKRYIGYSYSAQQFYVTQETLAGIPAEAGGSTVLNVTFDAFGDSAHDVELT